MIKVTWQYILGIKCQQLQNSKVDEQKLTWMLTGMNAHDCLKISQEGVTMVTWHQNFWVLHTINLATLG